MGVPLHQHSYRVSLTNGSFQEEMFTRRELTFIGGQVVFQCNSITEFREDYVFENEIPNEIQKPGKRRRSDDIGEYEGLIQSYSEKVLTYDSDIYQAFAGIARYIKSELKTNLCHGIPETYFDWFLLWTNLKPLRRREFAPSWSWSGWTGGSWPHMWDWYNRSISKIHKAQRRRTWIAWYERVAHDSVECRPIWKYDKPSDEGRKRLEKRCVRYGLDLDCGQTDPTPRTLSDAPTYYKDILNSDPRPASGFLQFWTVSLKLRLDSPASKAKNRGPSNTCSRLAMFGKSGHELGIVFVTETWQSEHVPGVHEFILLCQGRDARAESGQEDEEDGWGYMAMLVEWHGAWAQRVSVGSIAKHDLKEALEQGPVWKEIILG